MPTANTFVIPEFPGREAALALVRERVHERDERRRARLEAVSDLGPRRFTEALDALRVRMTFNARQTPKKRGSAFAAIADHDLALLDRAMARYEASGRLKTLHGDRWAQELVDALRVNYVTQEPIVSGPIFREIARRLLREALSLVLRNPVSASMLIPVLPWRAALICGEVYRAMGMTRFWHLGARRNEQTLATEIYHETLPPGPLASPRVAGNPTHLVCDPMLATGGTTMTAIERVLASGVPERDIVVHSVVAAPEGVDLLLHTYPDLRIVTCALDEKLDQNGYIAGPGLGDFGDLAFGDIDQLYAEVHWVAPGLLTDEQATIILDRMRAVRS